MTVVPVVPMVSLVSVNVSVGCFGDCSACSASGVLGVTIDVLWGALMTIVSSVLCVCHVTSHHVFCLVW